MQLTVQQQLELQETLDRFYAEMEKAVAQTQITEADVRQVLVEEAQRGHDVLFTSRRGEA